MAKYYYNGVLLPEIPADEFANCPYLMILKHSEGNVYVYGSTSKPYYNVQSSVERLELPSGRTRTLYNTTNDVWGEANTSTASTWCNLSESWTIVWSNFNIPNGSETATAIYFYSTYPIPEADECYYNGVLLPEIPADVLAEYPYCLMYYNSSNGNMQLLLGKGIWYVAPSTESKYTYQLWCSVNNDIQWYYCNVNSGTTWSFYKTTYGWWGDIAISWSNHDIPNGSATATTIYFYGNSPVSAEPVVPSDRTSGYLIQSGDSLFTVTDGVLTAVNGSLTAELFRTYGVNEVPASDLLATLTDPEILYWQDSTDDLPDLTLTVKGTPPLPQMFTSEPMDLTHESIAGINYAAVDASEDVRFAISFDGGTTWQAFDGSAWFNVSDTAPGMLASTMNAITAEQWAEVVVPDSYMVRFWLPNVTAYVASVVMHYINP